LPPSFKGNLRSQGHKILARKTRDLEAAHSKDFIILGIQCQGVTDGRTDGQTPRDVQSILLSCVKNE